MTPEQLEWCEQHLPTGRWKVNEEGLVDVEGNVDFGYQKFKRLPVAFGRVSGCFDLECCKQLLTLEGSPREVGGYFDCQGCTSLQSLKGAPQIVKQWFNCEGCTGLQSLEGAPQSMGGWFNCSDCIGLPGWVYGLSKEFNKEKISWKELLQLHEKLLYRPKLGQAKNLGIF